MAWDSEEIRKGREDAWFRENEEKMIEAARKKREAAEKERSSAEAEERRRAHWQKCPKCGGDMKVEKISGIEIDKCSSCERIFFDRGDLEELLLKQEPQRRRFFRKLMGFGEG